jgi:hypothetical protein
VAGVVAETGKRESEQLPNRPHPSNQSYTHGKGHKKTSIDLGRRTPLLTKDGRGYSRTECATSPGEDRDRRKTAVSQERNKRGRGTEGKETLRAEGCNKRNKGLKG